MPHKGARPLRRSPGKDTAGSRSCRSPGFGDTTSGSWPRRSLGQLQGPRGDRRFSDDDQCLGGRASSPGKCEAPSPTGWPHPLLRQASFPGNTFPILTQSKRPCNHLRAPVEEAGCCAQPRPEGPGLSGQDRPPQGSWGPFSRGSEVTAAPGMPEHTRRQHARTYNPHAFTCAHSTGSVPRIHVCTHTHREHVCIHVCTHTQAARAHSRAHTSGHERRARPGSSRTCTRALTCACARPCAQDTHACSPLILPFLKPRASSGLHETEGSLSPEAGFSGS